MVMLPAYAKAEELLLFMPQLEGLLNRRYLWGNFQHVRHHEFTKQLGDKLPIFVVGFFCVCVIFPFNFHTQHNSNARSMSWQLYSHAKITC